MIFIQLLVSCHPIIYMFKYGTESSSQILILAYAKFSYSEYAKLVSANVKFIEAYVELFSLYTNSGVETWS